MITLYGYIPAWGLPDISPYVTKTDCYLRMAGLPYELVTLPGGDLSKTPKGKLPFIEDQGRIVADTSFILEYLKDSYGDTLDADLDPERQAVSLAFTRMMDESFYWYLVQTRYRSDEDFKVYDPLWEQFLSNVPPEDREAAVRDFREEILKQFYYSGKGRHSVEEVEHLACREIDALAALLGDKSFLMGDRPASVDAAVYAFLWHGLRVPFESGIKAHGNAKPNLVRYMDRMFERYYPDLKTGREEAAGG